MLVLSAFTCKRSIHIKHHPVQNFAKPFPSLLRKIKKCKQKTIYF